MKMKQKSETTFEVRFRDPKNRMRKYGFLDQETALSKCKEYSETNSHAECAQIIISADASDDEGTIEKVWVFKNGERVDKTKAELNKARETKMSDAETKQTKPQASNAEALIEQFGLRKGSLKEKAVHHLFFRFNEYIPMDELLVVVYGKAAGNSGAIKAVLGGVKIMINNNKIPVEIKIKKDEGVLKVGIFKS
jgi:hypothetical protein